MKKLVIAEKPSVAREIAKTVGSSVRGAGYLEGNEYVVTWALGHLVELAPPVHYSERYKRWSLNDLPMLPDTLDQEVIENTKDQFENIKALFGRSDIASVVIATDAGREGELVARWILSECGYDGKIERLWISSQTEKAIRDGFASLKDGHLYDNLYMAAKSRAEADWYVGMNVTRALTCYYDAKMSAGRVQTPTLALMTRREDEIDEFLGQYYYTSKANFGLFSASYYPTTDTIRYKDDKEKEEVEALAGKEAVVESITTELKEEKAPLAYDLTELQRDANIRLGFSAKETLDVLQRLYEVHKIVSYPRTDSRYISSDIVPTLPDRLLALKNTKFGELAQNYRANGFVVDEERFVQEALVTDHHAIIPTEQPVKVEALSGAEEKLWSLIAERYLEVLSPSYTYKTTTAIIDAAGKKFKTRLTLPVSDGFRAVAKAVKDTTSASLDIDLDNNFALLNMKEGDKLKIESVKTRKQTTTPPERYTDATLLSAMEHAGRFVEDSSLKANLTNGLGTPATRADIIEKLVQNNYVEREGKYFIPTAKGREVIRLAPDVLKSPELTGKWEARLDAISRGKEEAAPFIRDIKAMAVTLVGEVKRSNLVFDPKLPDAKECPYCHSKMLRVKDEAGVVHNICQRLSCGYEEKEVKVRLETGMSGVKNIPSSFEAGKVKVTISRGAVKVPKAVYQTRIEVVNESKLNRKPRARSEHNFNSSSPYAYHEKKESFSSSSGGGTMADFFKLSEDRRKKDAEKKGKRK
jgi:DNA topoisomerase III, bacteria and conjugative plasmid